MKKMVLAVALMTGAAGISGCTGALLTGAAATGIAVAEERSVGNVMDDAVIQTTINKRMLDQNDSAKLFVDVNLTVVEGTVFLTGTVDNQGDKDKAFEIAFGVNGVKNVVNELIIDPSGAIMGLAKDSWVTTQLRGRVLGDGKIRDINYTFDTVNRVVFLMGIARDKEEMDRLVYHARTISGVEKVVNHVKIGAASN